MKELLLIGKEIRDKRLSLNMRMCDLAKRANITRSTLSSIENGKGNYSINTLLSIFNILGISINLMDDQSLNNDRERATRLNSSTDKKINRFIIMCVEQFASYKQRKSKEVYREMLKKYVIDELKNDYDDLHGMSREYLNDYIDSLLGG